MDGFIAFFAWLPPGLGLVWLIRRRLQIAPASLPGRWTKLRAVAVIGGPGAIVFGVAKVIVPLSAALAAGRVRWPGSFFVLAHGASPGFLVGVAFAIALGVASWLTVGF